MSKRPRRNHAPAFKCDLLDLSRSFVYYTPAPLSASEMELMRKIDEIHLEYPFFGTKLRALDQTAPIRWSLTHPPCSVNEIHPSRKHWKDAGEMAA